MNRNYILPYFVSEPHARDSYTCISPFVVPPSPTTICLSPSLSLSLSLALSLSLSLAMYVCMCVRLLRGHLP